MLEISIMPINTNSYSLHLHQLAKLTVILVASCASFSTSADTPNISDQYFEDIANPLSLNFDTYKGLASTSLEVIDVDQDGLKDIVVHFWEPDRSQQRTGVTPNFLKVFRLTSSFSFEDYTEKLFGRELIDLGGASRNIEVADLNNDGLLDVVFSINQEDGRIDANNEYSDGELAAMLSTSEGYEIVNFGTPSWYHSLGIGMLPNGTNFVTGNGFSGGIKAEIFSFNSNNEPILNNSGDLEIPPNAFRFLNGNKDHSTQLIRNANHPNMFGVIAYELIDNEWTKTGENLNPYLKIGEIQFKGWNGADYDTVDVIDIGGVPSIGQGGFSYAESCTLKVSPEADEIVVLKLNSAEIPNFGNQEYYEQNELNEYNILIGFEIKNSEVIRHPLKIDKEKIYTNFNFIDCLDSDGDSYQDIVAYAYKTTPLIYINNQHGEFNLLDNTKLPDIENSEVWPANTAAASIEESSILRDFTGDGIPDLFFWPANGIAIEDFGNDFTEGLGLKFFVGKEFLSASVLGFTFGDDAKPIAGVEVTQTESDGTITVYASDSNGQITLPKTINTYTLQAFLADTGSDPISVQDALFVLQHIVELRTLDADQIKAADINGDGKITIQDALKVLQHNVELTTINQNLIFYDANTGNLLSETTFNPGDTPSITVIRLGDVNESFDPGG